MKYRIINPDGYSLQPRIKETALYGKQMYEVQMPDKDKLKILRGDNVITLDNHYFTDLGSVPTIIQGIYGMERNRWEISYITHDCSYIMGLYINGVLTVLPRRECDQMLYDLIPVEGRMKDKKRLANFVRPIIWSGVRLGGAKFYKAK